MSLILDALKRAERERQAERSAALADVPDDRATRPRRRWGRWLALSVLGLVVAAAAVNLALRPRPATPVANPTAAPAAQSDQALRPATRTPAPTPSTAIPPPAQAPIQARPAPAQPPVEMRPQISASPPPVLPGTEDVASLDDLTPESDVDLEPAAPPAAESAPPPELTAEPEAAPLEPEPEARPEPAVEQTVPAPAASTTSPPAPRPVPPALTQKAPPRKLREMPPEYRADFPALTVEVHVFEPGRRFVMINGRRYREGERLQEGPQIVEIVRDGVVMDFRGERVLFPLGR